MALSIVSWKISLGVGCDCLSFCGVLCTRLRADMLLHAAATCHIAYVPFCSALPSFERDCLACQIAMRGTVYFNIFILSATSIPIFHLFNFYLNSQCSVMSRVAG